MGLFDRFKRGSKPDAIPEQEPEKPKYVHIHFNLAGTTQDTDGVSRQTLIRKIKQQKPPFDDFKTMQIELIETDFKGETAIECRFNDIMIGWVPKNRIDEILFAMDQKGAGISAFDVVGGKTVNGERLNYGMQIVFRYDND